MGNSQRNNPQANEPASAQPGEVTESSSERNDRQRAIPTHELLAYNIPGSKISNMRMFVN